MIFNTTICFGDIQETLIKKQYKVGLCIVATGNYSSYLDNLINSARQFFCKKHKVTFFIFTDSVRQKEDDVVLVHQKKLGWPYDSMKRFHMYDECWNLLQNMDYIFLLMQI